MLFQLGESEAAQTDDQNQNGGYDGKVDADHHQGAGGLLGNALGGDVARKTQQYTGDPCAQRAAQLGSKVARDGRGAIHTGHTQHLIVGADVHNEQNAVVGNGQGGNLPQHITAEHAGQPRAGEERDTIARDTDDAEGENHLAHRAHLLHDNGENQHDGYKHKAHNAEQTLHTDVANDPLEIVRADGQIGDNVVAQHNQTVQPDILVAAQQLTQLFQADGFLLALGVNGGILLAEDKASQADDGGGDHDDGDHAGPACGACGHLGHQDREKGTHHDGTCHRDNAAVAGNFLQQHRIVGERADGVRVHGGVAQRCKNAEGQRVHTEDPCALDNIAPCGVARKQQNRANGHTDNRQLIRATFAELGVGVVHNDARNHIGDRIHRFARQQQRTDGQQIDAQCIGRVDRKVVQHDQVDPCRHDVRTLERQQATKAQLIGVFSFVSCHDFSPSRFVEVSH